MKESTNMSDDYAPGDIFQINDLHTRQGWIGALVQAVKLRDWGIHGFILVPRSDDLHGEIHLRLNWNEITFIGHGIDQKIFNKYRIRI